MPWLQSGQSDAWETAGNFLKIAKHPVPNTKRVNALFRFRGGRVGDWPLFSDGAPVPRASKYIFRIRPSNGGNGTWYNGWLEVDAISEGVLFGSTGPDPDGQVMELEVIEYSSAPDPELNLYGIMSRWTYRTPAKADFSFGIMAGEPNQDDQISVPHIQNWRVLGSSTNFEDDPTEIDTDWESVPVSNNFVWQSLAECYQIIE